MTDDHALAALLANIVDEWFRYYGASDAQVRQILDIISRVWDQYPETGTKGEIA